MDEQQQPEVKETPKSIVEKTMESLNPDGTPKEMKPDDKKVDDKKDKKPSDDDKKTDDLSDDDKELAFTLLRQLKNPETAPQVIEWFAKQGGFTKAEEKKLDSAIDDLKDGTKQEKKEAVDDITALFTEQFGEEFAAKLAPAIKKAIEKGVEERTKDIKQTFQERELRETTNQANTVLDEIGNKFYEKDGIPSEIRGEMNRLMDVYSPSKDQTLEDYLNDIHALAAAKKGGSLKPVDKTRQERIDKSKSDVPGRLNNGRSPAPSKENADLPPAKNLQEAVARAEQQLRESMK